MPLDQLVIGEFTRTSEIGRSAVRFLSAPPTSSCRNAAFRRRRQNPRDFMRLSAAYLTASPSLGPDPRQVARPRTRCLWPRNSFSAGRPRPSRRDLVHRSTETGSRVTFGAAPFGPSAEEADLLRRPSALKPADVCVDRDQTWRVRCTSSLLTQTHRVARDPGCVAIGGVIS